VGIKRKEKNVLFHDWKEDKGRSLLNQTAITESTHNRKKKTYADPHCTNSLGKRKRKRERGERNGPLTQKSAKRERVLCLKTHREL